MAKRMGGTAAKNGFYWNLRKWEMTMVPAQGGILPGGAGDAYLKVPIIGLLVLAPMMGAVYAMFLPFIGFALLFTFLGQKALAATRTGAMGVGATLSPSWRPGEAYLAGTKKQDADAENGDDVDAASTDASVQGNERSEPRRPDVQE